MGQRHRPCRGEGEQPRRLGVHLLQQLLAVECRGHGRERAPHEPAGVGTSVRGDEAGALPSESARGAYLGHRATLGQVNPLDEILAQHRAFREERCLDSA